MVLSLVVNDCDNVAETTALGNIIINAMVDQFSGTLSRSNFVVLLCTCVANDRHLQEKRILSSRSVTLLYRFLHTASETAALWQRSFEALDDDAHALSLAEAIVMRASHEPSLATQDVRSIASSIVVSDVTVVSDDATGTIEGESDESSIDKVVLPAIAIVAAAVIGVVLFALWWRRGRVGATP